MKRSDALLNPFVVTVIALGLIALALTLTRGCGTHADYRPRQSADLATVIAERDLYKEKFRAAFIKAAHLEYRLSKAGILLGEGE